MVSAHVCGPHRHLPILKADHFEGHLSNFFTSPSACKCWKALEECPAQFADGQTQLKFFMNGATFP